MRVLHVIPSLSPTSGGPSFALPAMVRALDPHEVSIVAATTDDDGPGRRMEGVRHGVQVSQGNWNAIYFPKQTEFYKVSLPLSAWLRLHVRDFDVVHIHALFSFASLAAGRAAAANGVPFIVRPLGVLNRWGMENRRRRVKALSFRLLELPMLRRASAMHYTSRIELDDATRFGLTCLQRVIPLGIDVAPFASLPAPTVFAHDHPETSGTRNILFFSRLDVKKGLDMLIAAFALLHPKEAGLRLIICGDGDPPFVASLKQQAVEAGVEESITWAGQVVGDQRFAAFATAQIFVLPSHSENFGIALLEAMAAGLPCISTDQVALAADAASQGAVMIAEREPEALAGAMRELIESEPRSKALGQAARRLAQEQYSLDAMGRGLHQLYQEVIE
ncbi:MAG: glycosyltransferase [Verrucomicrobiales bacterium]|nr:glycosyltransferase [Verrucomicrobiales bacterium]